MSHTQCSLTAKRGCKSYKCNAVCMQMPTVNRSATCALSIGTQQQLTLSMCEGTVSQQYGGPDQCGTCDAANRSLGINKGPTNSTTAQRAVLAMLLQHFRSDSSCSRVQQRTQESVNTVILQDTDAAAAAAKCCKQFGSCIAAAPRCEAPNQSTHARWQFCSASLQGTANTAR